MLGGRPPMPALRPGACDLAFSDGFVLELDEELHFNCYRAQSLQSARATELECLAAGKWGKRWTN
jgi:hypothetical protein